MAWREFCSQLVERGDIEICRSIAWKCFTATRPVFIDIDTFSLIEKTVYLTPTNGRMPLELRQEVERNFAKISGLKHEAHKQGEIFRRETFHIVIHFFGCFLTMNIVTSSINAAKAFEALEIIMPEAAKELYEEIIHDITIRHEQRQTMSDLPTAASTDSTM